MTITMEENEVKAEKKESFPEREERILASWKANRIFEKTLEATEGKNPYVFYDGPPFEIGRAHV